MEVQQSSLYATYIASLGWRVVELESTNIFVRHFPLFGGLAKIQRSKKLPSLNRLIPLLKTRRIRTVSVEPDSSIRQSTFSSWCNKLRPYVRLNFSPFLPTKTLLIDLKPPEEEIFMRFSEAKRRAVRRALKNNLHISESANIQDFIKIKNKSAGILGFITTYGIRKLWNIFAPKHAAILLAYHNDKQVGGVLLLFYDRIAYYWIAGATHEGKKLFAPTLLVWESIKLAKKRGSGRFDFVGVWDQRNPNKFHEWKGFTKFKEGFGATAQYYPLIP